MRLDIARLLGLTEGADNKRNAFRHYDSTHTVFHSPTGIPQGLARDTLERSARGPPWRIPQAGPGAPSGDPFWVLSRADCLERVVPDGCFCGRGRIQMVVSGMFGTTDFNQL